MRKLARSATLFVALTSPPLMCEANAFAQDGTAPATAAFPPTLGDAPASAPVTPTAPPASAPVAPTAPPSSASAAAAPDAPSNPLLAAPPPLPPAYPPPPTYSRGPNASPDGSAAGGYGAPPPPPLDPDSGFRLPDISVRVDPFNFLLEGRLGLELEAQLSKMLTIELVPVFVTTHSPPTLNYSSYENSVITQSSNGVGPISGAAVDAGFWFGRKPFEGYVLRVGLSNYSYTYDTKDNGAPVDSVSHNDREIFAMLGDHHHWGAFAIAAGVGLGYELNKQNRCFDDLGSPVSSCPKDETLIYLDKAGTYTNLNSTLYPFDLLARFSLGVVF